MLQPTTNQEVRRKISQADFFAWLGRAATAHAGEGPRTLEEWLAEAASRAMPPARRKKLAALLLGAER